VALSRPFLSGQILFSSISPDYEEYLKEELFGCFKYVGIPFDVLDRMPIRDRRYYIIKHNEYIERENEKYNELRNGGNSKSTSSNINQFAAQSQQAALGGGNNTGG